MKLIIYLNITKIKIFDLQDRFGIYLPGEKIFNTGNITVTPAVSESSDDGSSDKATELS